MGKVGCLDVVRFSKTQVVKSEEETETGWVKLNKVGLNCGYSQT